MLIISSKNGLAGASDKSLYSSVKGGGITMARSLAQELGPFGIRVNVICPDAVHKGSKLWEPGGDYSVGTAKRYNITEAQIPDYYRRRCALKVNMEPEDIADAALFLCSRQSDKITGAVLTVDGGVAFVR
jgi:NAD(P)-dependent dehydrogenase (short-subunit alcohol dehydrogenase family)